MSEEETADVATSETSGNDQGAQESPEGQSKEKRQVPLDALEAERRKRQEAEYQAKWYAQQIAQLQSQGTQKQKKEPEEDEYTRQIKEEIRRDLHIETQSRLEARYLADHPEVADAIQSKLAPILQKKPHLSYAIQHAENRYAEAMDIISKYSPQPANDAVKKQIEKSKTMPGSPASTGKPGGISKSEMLDRMVKNKREFSQYRAKLRGKAPNIR